MGDILRKVNRGAHKAILLVAEVALVVMVILVSLNVAYRIAGKGGLGVAEEIARLLVTLFAFLAMAMGVRDHTHIGVNIVYNLFPKEGKMRRFMEYLADVIVLLCGLFMLYYGGRRCIQMFSLPGKLPMTGWSTWIQYLPIPLAGFVISFDSILFLTGVLKRDDLLYSEPEVDFLEELKRQQEEQKEVEA